jgi:hypothetical protein
LLIWITLKTEEMYLVWYNNLSVSIFPVMLHN